jgi:hypothetical protein
MSTTTDNNTVKTSYKNVVALEDIQHSCDLEKPNYTTEYDSFEVVQPLVLKDMLQRDKFNNKNQTTHIPLPMRYLMSDIIEPLGDLTNDIKEVYELQGIANTLKLSDVLDAFEKSVNVTYLGDIDVEQAISDDDAVNATTTLA